MSISPFEKPFPRPKGSCSRFKSAAASALCLLLPSQLLPAQAQPPQADITTEIQALPHPKQPVKLDADQRVLHLLNRFTFGPTLEDISAFEKMANNDPQATKASTQSGISTAQATDRAIYQWFEDQVHPDRLPQTASDQLLQAKLAEFPALALPTGQLLENFPSGAIIRQTANGKHPMPNDSLLATIYQRHIDQYQDKQEKKAEAQKVAASADGMMAGGTSVTSMNASPAATASNSAPNLPSQAAEPRPDYSDLEIKTILTLPPTKRFNRLLTMPRAQYDQLRAALKGPQKQQLVADLTPREREIISDYDNPTGTVIRELQSQRLLRDIYSSHQLQEVMTTFWLNHFNVFVHKNEETPYYLVSYERDVIRPHALGNFEDLLVATAESPAMLLYLDNSSSTGPGSMASEKQKLNASHGKNPNKTTPPGLNENYARELMELHTLGVNGGYTQKDVTEVARVFTGWTVDHPGEGGPFRFDETRHEPGKKLVLGHKIKENGQKEGLELLHILATSPATAHFISSELAAAFVSDNPPPGLVNRMAQSFLQSHGDIPSVLRTMLHSPEFWSPAVYQAKVKTPLEYVISAARASQAEITDPQPLIQALNQMGMPLYGCVPPTGYAGKADAWVSTGALVTRMNFGLALGANKSSGVQVQWNNTTPTPEATPEIAEQHIEARLVPAGLSENTRAAILNQIQATQPSSMPAMPSSTPNKLQVAQLPDSKARTNSASRPAAPTAQDNQAAQIAGLLLGSPEFQRR